MRILQDQSVNFFGAKLKPILNDMKCVNIVCQICVPFKFLRVICLLKSKQKTCKHFLYSHFLSIHFGIIFIWNPTYYICSLLSVPLSSYYLVSKQLIVFILIIMRNKLEVYFFLILLQNVLSPCLPFMIFGKRGVGDMLKFYPF